MSKVFQSHFKFSQVDEISSSTMNSELCHSPTNYFTSLQFTSLNSPQLQICHWTLFVLREALCTHPAENSLYCWTIFCKPSRRGPHTKHGLPSTVTSIRVYWVVAWQCIDPIRNSIAACIFRGFCDSALLAFLSLLYFHSPHVFMACLIN
jgi:hypothetical protein